MADPFATLDDVTALFRALTEAEAPVVERLLALASRVVRAQVPSIDERISAGTLDPELVRDVVAGMVVRALRNPAGVKQQAVGPMSVTYDGLAGLVYLAAQELAQLQPVGSPSRRVGTIRLAAGLGSPIRPRW